MNAGTEGNVLRERWLDWCSVCCVREVHSGCCAPGVSMSGKLL